MFNRHNHLDEMHAMKDTKRWDETKEKLFVEKMERTTCINQVKIILIKITQGVFFVDNEQTDIFLILCSSRQKHAILIKFTKLFSTFFPLKIHVL